MSATVPEHGVDRSVDLLVTLLIRYPELSAVHVSPSGHTLELSFLLSGAAKPHEIEACAAKIRSSLDALSRLVQQNPGHERRVVVRRQSYDTLTRLIVSRDLSDLVPEEFAIIVAVVKESLGKLLIVDDAHEPPTDLLDDAEAIADTLNALRTQQPGRELIGIRDGGRVLVFK
ncbi:MAG TPA: hypothetical protein VK101_10590 [Limnochordia bacterium]|nr:hypothetical protein [Limnochordia bacterium]